MLLVNLTPIQNFIAKQITSSLSQKLKTKVTISHIRIDFFNHLLVKGLLVADQQKDTVLYCGELSLSITDWFFLKNETAVLKNIGLEDAYIHLYRKSKSAVWNYQFIADAFASNTVDTSTKETNIDIDLKMLRLKNIRFHLDDSWTGMDNDIDVGKATIDVKDIDFKKKSVDLNNIDIEKAIVAIRDYVGGKPKSIKPTVETIDTTAFNPGKWTINLPKLSITKSIFTLDATERNPYPNEFDYEHILIKDIVVNASKIKVVGDTIHGNLKLLSVKERSGLEIKKMSAVVTVSPNESICENLFLETNRSQIHDYFAMRYERFPDFIDYNEKVVMEGNLTNAYVDTRDIEFFAPPLKIIQEKVLASGYVKGTVANLVGKNILINNGQSKLSGDITMVGLPDIYKTTINFENGNIKTNNQEICRYAKDLNNNPNVDFKQIDAIEFAGSFNGLIENFKTKGKINSNIGQVDFDLQLQLPDFDYQKFNYKGTISGQKLSVGKFLKIEKIGLIDFNTKVDGYSFDPQLASANIDASINSIQFNNYDYHKIDAQGTLKRKKFNGQCLIDDENLALAFYGGIDFNNKDIQINAKANLLKSNFKALHFTEDSIAATADFDLDLLGSDFDKFNGYAKLYNINLIRKNRRVDVDSIFINSSIEDGQKSIIVQSNDITASVKGDFQLRSLPYSFQFYISGYLPNYIKAPTRYAPNQNINFKITTRTIDSLWAIVLPNIKGFNNSSISGVLNMNNQSLSLQSTIPYGVINNVVLTDVKLNGNGDFNKLNIDASAQNFNLSNGILTASMDVKASLGNDTLAFDIITKSNEAVGNAQISGSAKASGDSLYLHLLPSEFYINQKKWEILNGNELIFGKNYLMAKDWYLQSGNQKIEAFSTNKFDNQSLNISIKNVDINNLGGFLGIADYKPKGFITGDVVVDNIFNNLSILTKLQVKNVQFDKDTIGNIVIDGIYSSKNNSLSFDPKTGIFFKNSSIRAAGNVSLDSNNNQPINGYLQFNNALVHWINPFVSDYLSALSGNINGKINVSGSASEPDISGMLSLNDVTSKIDIIGTQYFIPSANIIVSNDKFSLNNLQVLDRNNDIAIVNGEIRHNKLRDFYLALNATSPKIEAINLKDFENPDFYGNLTAGVDLLTVTGPIDNINMNIIGEPVAKSKILIPIKSATDVNTYTYVTFKNYGVQKERKQNKKYKFSLSITGKMNTLADLRLVLDPTTGDEISATGNGTIDFSMPAEGNFKLNGRYEIEQGNYSFTLRQLAFKRNFTITSGSTIDFKGDISNMDLDIKGVYTTKARLYDLLDANEKSAITSSSAAERDEAKRIQNVNIRLDMKGSLNEPKLGFKIDLAEKRSETNFAYQKLLRINQNDRELFDQVAALLIVNTFIPPEGWVGQTALSGGISNFSEMVSSTASTQLTNIVNKLIGDQDLQIDLKYKNYNLSDPSNAASGINRNELSFGLKKNLFNDKLVLEVGNYYDWGRPTSSNSNTSNLNLAGDFRVQYLLTEDGRVRLNAFRTNNYDVLLDRNIWRGGVGVAYRKTFNSFSELLRKSKEKTIQINANPDSNRTELSGGTF